MLPYLRRPELPEDRHGGRDDGQVHVRGAPLEVTQLLGGDVGEGGHEIAAAVSLEGRQVESGPQSEVGSLPGAARVVGHRELRGNPFALGRWLDRIGLQ